jgi:fused signal recognition particle receptor
MVFRSIWKKLKQGLTRTRSLFGSIAQLFRLRGRVDQTFLNELEKRLYLADVGSDATTQIVERVKQAFLDKEITGDVEIFVKQQLKDLLSGASTGISYVAGGPTVVMIAGVNGSGKTTSIAKLANLLKKQGKKVVLAAGDTFRAAAVEQLTLWSQRLGCEIITKPSGSDPAAVAYAGCVKALESNADVLIVDTAGRLQTQQNLMKQLSKIQRVMGDKIPGAPHEVLLVLDATTGQNGVSQAQHFSQSVSCTGLILAKLDGTAKGGIVLAIRQMMNLPVKYVGVGEQVDDLELFDPDAFVDALFET